MTGGEIIGAMAAGKKAKELAEDALEADPQEKKALLELAKSAPAMQAAAETYAKRIAVKQQILLKIYQPLARLLGISRAYFEDDFAHDLAEHTVEIPDENLVSPPGNIALPAMQGLAFSLDEPQLKLMYLRLLAAASDDRRPHDAHPSFAQIIKELSSEEAKLLQIVLPNLTLAVARAKIILPTGGWHHVVHHLINWQDGEESVEKLIARASFVDNWIRLGLVEVDYAEHLLKLPDAPDPYEWVTTRPEYPKIAAPPETQSDSPTSTPPTVLFDRGVLRVTDFGRRFHRAVS